jgi:hypothetical protein
MNLQGTLTRTRIKQFIAAMQSMGAMVMPSGTGHVFQQALTASMNAFGGTLSRVRSILFAGSLWFTSALSRTLARQFKATLSAFVGGFLCWKSIPAILRAFAALVWPEDNRATLLQPGIYEAAIVQPGSYLGTMIYPGIYQANRIFSDDYAKEVQ